jgi:hypothetical protein
MKVVGKMGSNYMVNIPEEELLQIVFGVTLPEYNEKIKGKARELKATLDKGNVTELSANKVFIKMMELYNTKFEEKYDSLSGRLDQMKALLQPMVMFVEEIKHEVDNTNE